MKSISRIYFLNILFGLFIPFVIIGTVSVVMSYMIITDEITEKNAQLNYLLTSVVDTRLQEIVDLVSEYTDFVSEHINQEEVIRQFIKNIRIEHKIIINVYILNNQGYVRYISPYDKFMLGNDMSGYDFFKNYDQEKDFYWSASFLSPPIRYPQTALCKHFGEGMLVIFLDLAWILQDIEEILSLNQNKTAIIDQQGTFIAHSVPQKVRQSYKEPYFNKFKDLNQGKLFQARVSYKEEETICYVNFIPYSGWAIVVYQPLTTITRPISRMLITLSLITFLVLVISMLTTAGLLHALQENNRTFLTSVAKLEKGEYNYRAKEYKYKEFVELARNFNTMATAIENREQELIRSEERLKKVVKQKDTLLKEIHHRLKNNLSVIISLVQFQRSAQQDSSIQGILLQIQNRIKAMAIIHEKLYNSEDISNIDFKGYCEQFVHYFSSSTNLTDRGIEIIQEIPELPLHIEKAMPCGLILNELLTNSIKYAFTDADSGNIVIRAYKEGQTFILHYSDNGHGVEPVTKLETPRSIGMLIIHSLVEQLQGELNFYNSNGLNCRILFPLQL